MQLKILGLLLLMATWLHAQNAADIELVLGSGYKGFSTITAIKAQPDGKIVVGGSMTFGPQSTTWEGRVARFNADGSVDTGFEAVVLSNNGVINDIAVQSDGKIIVAGNFSVLNGESVSQIIRLNPDGTKDSGFTPTIGGAINSVALQPDGKIMIAGTSVTYINEHLQRYVLRLNANGTTDHSFDFGFAGFSSVGTMIYKVAVQPDGKILAGGYFNVFNGQPQGRIIRFNSDGSKDTSFEVGTGALSGNGVLVIIVQPDGKILVGGGFNTWNGQATGSLCRLNEDGSLDPDFFLGVQNTAVLQSALQQDGKIIAIGDLSVNGAGRRIVKLHSDGSLDTNFENVQVSNAINCVALQADNKVVVGGYLVAINGINKNSLARLNTNGALDTTFNLNTGLNDKVTTVALQTDNKTLLGGNFTTFDGLSQNKIIRILDDGTRDESFTIGSGFNNSVHKIVVQPDDKILVGGNFTQYNGVNANAIIRLNNDGTIDTSFTAGSGFNSDVKTIAVQSDGKIVVGGSFTAFNGEPQNYCVRLHEDGTKDNSFLAETGFNDWITCVNIQADGKIVLGGNFTTFNGQSQKHLIRLNAEGTKDASFDIGSGFTSVNNNNDIVSDLVVLANGSMYVTALSAWYNGNSVRMPVRLHADGTLDTGFMSAANISGSATIDAIAVQQSGKVIVGGTFMGINGINLNQRRIMRLHPDGTFDDTFDVTGGNPAHYGGFDTGVCSEIILQLDGKIWLAGSFFAYQGVSSFSAIRLVGDPILPVNEFESLPNTIVAYPNPVEHVLYFNQNFNTIAIRDLTGKIMKEFKNTNSIDFSNFSKGTYIVTLPQENGTSVSKKIIKQ